MSVSLAPIPVETAAPLFRLYVMGERDNFPAFNFLESLDNSNDEHSRIFAILDEVAQQGPLTNDKRRSRLICKNPKIFELKSPDKTRLAFFYDEGRVIIFTHGFKKPSKKELRTEIDTASKAYKRYFLAKANGTLTILPNE